ncbi:MAG TPA: molybdopterin molybdotransferase MoeA [Syntrophales bacterium]|nr:molybdopterin molybdotransferase MoeA [Syntrophales bacterium]HQN79041.1 molybdopterin molybdotransferase MoeA [Syntrophales bacterium]HQQ28024.1 molybdopterin molybdotransferase MoeA [Syntrophales bacterium]
MIAVEQALREILEQVPVLGLEKVDILEALGRVLGEDVRAPRDIPPQDNSAMDGFAVNSEDTLGAAAENPLFFDIVEDIPAGHVPQKIVGFAEAARIMTGASIPRGADAVVKVEDTEMEDGRVKFRSPVRKGENVRRSGEDVRMDEIVLTRGRKIRPAEIGMLASLGRSFVSVHQKPLVAVLATGNELADVDGILSPATIVSSNSYSLSAQVIEAGGIPLILGIAKDRKEDMKDKYLQALRADIIISSAGVSVGDYDLVKDVIQELGTDIRFWKVAMRPGRPLVFGTMGGKPIFGLPGNPVSSMISFEQFVRPSIRKMTGHTNLFRRTLQAALEEGVDKVAGLRFFLRGVVRKMDGKYVVSMTGEQGSGILKSMVLANGIIVLPEEGTKVPRGTAVTVQVLDDSL